MVEHEVVRQFVKVTLADAQRVDNHIVADEFHVVETAESRGILVLFAAGHLQVHAFDFVG